MIIFLLAAGFYLYEFILQAAPGVMQNELMQDLAVNATNLGIISGCFYVPCALLQLPAGLLLDRYSTRIILTTVCTCFAAGVLLFAHARCATTASIARFIMGGAASCAFISILHLVTHWIPRNHFALFVGLAEMLGALGGLLGTTILVRLLNHFNWRTVMGGFAYLGFILALLIVLLIRSQPPQIKKRAFPLTTNAMGDIREILRHRETWFLGIYSFCIWAPVIGLSLWGVEFFIVVHGLTKYHAAYTMAAMWLGIALASPLLGWLSDYTGKRSLFMILCALIGNISTLAMVFFVALPEIALIVLALGVGFASAGQTLAFVLIKDNHGLRRNGAANGINNTFVVAGGILLQPLMGKILDLHLGQSMHSGIHYYDANAYKNVLLLLPLCYCIATLIGSFFIRDKYIRTIT